MKQTLNIITISLLMVMAACCRDHDDTKQGAVIAIAEAGNDPVGDVHLWVFNNSGKQVSEQRYDSYSGIAGALLPITGGEYTFVTATNIVDPFKIQKGTTAATELENLYISLSDPSASPAHVHYGVRRAKVADQGITRVPLTISRAMAEVSFTIKDTPAEVAKATLEIINAAEGFYPGIGKLSAQNTIVSWDEQTPTGGNLTFPMKRVMPVVAPMVRGEELKTILRLTITYSNGGKLSFNLETPVIQNGGTYTPEIDYSILRMGIVIKISEINGWVELPPIDGEILNPTIH